MMSSKSQMPSDSGVFGQSLKEHRERIIAECAAALANEKKERENQSLLETIQKNLPLLLDELISLLPHVMAEEAKMTLASAGGIEFRPDHRLDVVIKALSGISEVAQLELLKLKGCVTDEVLAEVCRETRLFFDLKAAGYCLQFVKAQEAELALRGSQLKAACERLKSEAEAASASAHSRVEFLRGAIHELRNSLQSVLLHATSLMDCPRDPGAAHVMERLAMHGIRLQRLLDRLQEYSRLLAGDWPVRLEPVNVGAFLDELERMHHASARANSIQVVCRKISGPEVITTDVKKLNAIADNLVSNAIRYAKARKVQVEISEAEAGGLLLKVTDNGNGISLAEARQIFRVMHHVAGSDMPEFKLGLLATRHVTHLLGGEISFESEVGRGTVFTVVLPDHSTSP